MPKQKYIQTFLILNILNIDFFLFFSLSDLKEVMLHLIEKTMAENTRHKGYLIDGFPREIEQGIKFEKHVSEYLIILNRRVS